MTVSAQTGTDGVGDVTVVAAVLQQGSAFLLGLRPRNKRHGGLWEFPGGKVDPRELPAAALARELLEELGLAEVTVGQHLAAFQDPGSSFRIHFYAVQSPDSARALEHEAIRWVTLDEADGLPLAPSDRRMVEWLRAAGWPEGP
jgi:8-oxo-dGTP diphosphatase